MSFELFIMLTCGAVSFLLTQCYEKKGSGAAVAKDDDVRPWLRRFVENVGQDKAKRLLAHAGEFVNLG